VAIDYKAKMQRTVHSELIEPVINTNTDIKNNIKVDINNNINTDIIQQRPKYTETHKATMVYIEADLSAELDGYSKGKKGVKSKIINEALRQYLKTLK
jgi:uncharacterized protein (DUF4415 family)